MVEQHYPPFRELRAEAGFLRLRCEQCHAEKLVAFSCKKRGFCPSCGARRMAETAALLADEILPERPLSQWVLSLPMALRFLLATRPAVLSVVLGVGYRTISGHLLSEARLTRRDGHTGAAAGHGRPAGPGPAHRRTPRPDVGEARADRVRCRERVAER